MKKQNAVITAVAVAALAGGAAVAVPAFAATGDTGDSNSSSSSTATPGAKDANRVAPHKAALDKLVADGTITQAQADTITSQLEADRPARMKDGDGHEGRGGHGGMGGGMGRMGGGDMLDTAATTLKLSQDELRTKLQTQSLGQIADAAGVSRDSLVSAMEKTATADLKERLTEMLDRTPGERPGKRGDSNDSSNSNDAGSGTESETPSASGTAS